MEFERPKGSLEGVAAPEFALPDAGRFARSMAREWPEGGASGRNFDIQQILIILRKYRLTIILYVLLGVAASALYCFLTVPLFTASTQILITPRPSALADQFHEGPSMALDDSVLDSQVNLVASQVVLLRALDLVHRNKIDFRPPPPFPLLDRTKNLLIELIERLHSAGVPLPAVVAQLMFLPDMLEWEADARAGTEAELHELQKSLQIRRLDQTRIIEIAFTYRDPRVAAEIANLVAQAYLDDQVAAQQAQLGDTTSWLDGRLSDLATRLRASEDAVEAFKAENNLVSTSGELISDQQLSDLNNQLILSQVNAAEARARYENAVKVADRKADSAAIKEVLDSPVIVGLRNQIALLSARQAEVLQTYGPRHPTTLNMDAELADARHLLDEEIARIITSRRNEYNVAVAREKTLAQQVSRLTTDSKENSRTLIRLHALQREADSNRMLFENLLDRSKQTGVLEQLRATQARVIALANAPKAPSHPKVLMLLAVGAIIGAGCGGGVALTRASMDRTIDSEEEVEALSGAECIGSLPLVRLDRRAGRPLYGRSASPLRPRPVGLLTAEAGQAMYGSDPDEADSRPRPRTRNIRPFNEVIEKPGSHYAECMRSVHATLRALPAAKRLQMLMVVSALPGEGKSTTIMNLAQVEALHNDGRVVLVDLDLRNPGLSRAVAPQAARSLTDVLEGKATIDDVLLQDPLSGLFYLPVGHAIEPNLATRLMWSTAMRDLLLELRERFDLIFIDGPPILAVADQKAVADQIDAVLLVVKWNSTPRLLISQTVKQLGRLPQKSLSVIVNQVDRKQVRYYYGSGSYGSII